MCWIFNYALCIVYSKKYYTDKKKIYIYIFNIKKQILHNFVINSFNSKHMLIFLLFAMKLGK